MRQQLFPFVLVAITTAVAPADEPSPQPHGRYASLAAAKQAILDDLSAYSAAENPRWLLGQNAGHGNVSMRTGYQRNITRLQAVTGDLPALLGVDLGFDEIPQRLTTARELAREFWHHGGLVTVSMHPPSPFRNSNVHDVRTVDWDEIDRPDSVVRQRWQRTLGRAAEFLEQLQDDGVVVLWRPFHEMNGGWFWWCARHRDGTWTTKQEFHAIWKQMHHSFAERGLDNLLWVYAPAVQTGTEQRSVAYYYPGDEFVDVVGLDWYDDRFQDLDSYGSYRQLVAFGKPMGLTEVGPRTQRHGEFDNLALARAMQRYPRLGFAMFWHSWPGANVALVDNQHAKQLVTRADVITLDKLRTAQPKQPPE